MQHFLGNQCTDSGFAFETFGNPRSDGLPDDALLSLNTVDDSTLEKGYLIANGVKISVDETGRRALENIARNKSLSLKKLLSNFNQSKHNEIKELVCQLNELDFIETTIE